MICLWNEDECACCKIYDKEMHDIRSYLSKSMKSRIEYEAKIVKVEMLGHCLENKSELDSGLNYKLMKDEYLIVHIEELKMDLRRIMCILEFYLIYTIK